MEELFNSIFTEKTRKVMAVGKNYLSHAQETGATLPATPIIFQKPLTSIIDSSRQIVLPADQEIHHESTL
jgi:2-keto-4-pentenoate hydratase/2-oxohepta-3-ene-1,7-dioic acid hydratase in catechol pathway